MSQTVHDDIAAFIFFSERVEDNEFGFTGAVRDAGIVRSQEFRESFMNEFFDRRFFDHVKNAAAEITDGIAVSPFEECFFGFRRQLSGRLERIDIDEIVRITFDACEHL